MWDQPLENLKKIENPCEIDESETVIDKKNYLVNKKILVEIIARTRIMAQLELRPTSEVRVFIIARAIN